MNLTSHARQQDARREPEIEFAPVEVICEKLAGGGFLLRSSGRRRSCSSPSATTTAGAG